MLVSAAAFVAAPAAASATEATHVPSSPAPTALLSYTWDVDGLTSSSSTLTSGLAQAYAFTRMVQWWRDNIDGDEQGLVDLDWGAVAVYENGSEDFEVDGYVYNKTTRRYCFIPWEVTRTGPATASITQLFTSWCDDY
jgi:hypothetical protein